MCKVISDNNASLLKVMSDCPNVSQEVLFLGVCLLEKRGDFVRVDFIVDLLEGFSEDVAEVPFEILDTLVHGPKLLVEELLETVDFLSLLPCHCLFSGCCLNVPSGEFFICKCAEGGLLFSDLSSKSLSAFGDELFETSCLSFESLRECFNEGVDIAVSAIVVTMLGVANWFIAKVWRICEAALGTGIA
jgi:hypothetical protein